MALVDLDNEFLELFFNITNTKIPENVQLVDLKKQLIEIVDTLKELNKNAKKPIANKIFGVEESEEESTGPAILVVDDLGVITYQLKVLLSQLNARLDIHYSYNFQEILHIHQLTV